MEINRLLRVVRVRTRLQARTAANIKAWGPLPAYRPPPPKRTPAFPTSIPQLLASVHLTPLQAFTRASEAFPTRNGSTRRSLFPAGAKLILGVRLLSTKRSQKPARMSTNTLTMIMLGVLTAKPILQAL